MTNEEEINKKVEFIMRPNENGLSYTPDKQEQLIKDLLKAQDKIAREAMVEKIKGMKRNQEAPKENDPHFTGCGACGRSYPAICGCKEVNEVLDTIISSLIN
jgi:hypothetical protein